MINDKSKDDRYEKLTNYITNKATLFRDNDLEAFINEKLEKDQTPINLYGRVLYGLNIKDEDINFDRMNEITDILNNSYSKIIFIISLIISGIILLYVAAILFVIYSKPKEKENSEEKKDTNVDCFCCVCSGENAILYINIGFGIIASIVNLIDYIFDILILKNINELKKILNKMSENTDKYSKILINELSDYFYDNYSYSLGIVIGITISIISIIVAVILFCREKDDEKKEKENKYYNSF